ncbi:hypothetical protein SDC9_147756 [bioreactor metagenome]|uniref:Uncharacterized protein n=1 Tax=bioreactor metagenome TaxID=1076179 RepID=A0A645EGW0_9ZZZZ
MSYTLSPSAPNVDFITYYAIFNSIKMTLPNATTAVVTFLFINL